MTYTVSHTVQDGIERIVYLPEPKRFETPILMQHGMWHGAWCWQSWQELFAEWGWESIAFSLPGHGQSPRQRPIRWCTLSYYLKFLAAEIERLPQRPILMGHSMGGALTQWYSSMSATLLFDYALRLRSGQAQDRRQAQGRLYLLPCWWPHGPRTTCSGRCFDSQGWTPLGFSCVA